MVRKTSHTISIPLYLWELAQTKTEGTYVKPTTFCVNAIKGQFTTSEINAHYQKNNNKNPTERKIVGELEDGTVEYEGTEECNSF